MKNELEYTNENKDKKNEHTAVKFSQSNLYYLHTNTMVW